MTSHYARASEIFQVACELPRNERSEYLDEACRGAPELRAEVEELLTFDVDPGDIEPDSPPHETLPPGSLFAERYRIVTWLGRGSMGIVYRAIDERLGEMVALKVLRASSPARREQLVREVRLARQVTHPAVCRVHDIGENDSECFLTMEFVDGENLAALLMRAGRISPERVLQIAGDLLGGIGAAHAEGVLHRDLKPANLLMDNSGRVRITDFGIALGGDDGFSMPAGTPNYMAPEQRAGSDLSSRTDLYSLGVVLYELLTGATPEERIVPPSELVSGIDPRLERAILAALDPDPERRPASARVMLGILEGPETETGPVASPAVGHTEQRLVTAVFLNFTPSTEYARSLSPEVLRELLHAARAVVLEAFERHGGRMTQRLGSSVVFLFGYPVAYADASARAIEAALELRDAALTLNEEWQDRLDEAITFQAGIHSGSDLVETGPSGEIFSYGSAILGARALASQARADEILASDDVQDRAGDVEGAAWDARGALELPGVDTPISVLAVERAERPLRVSVPDERAMVGRQEELDLLLERWKRVEAGVGQLVLIRGDAGIGKSKLVRAFREQLVDRSHNWAEAVCTPYTSNTPLYPHSQIVVQVCGISSEDPLEARIASLRETMEHYDVYRPELFEPFVHLLALEQGVGSHAVNPAAAKARLLVALHALSKRYSEDRPYVSVIEDLHWADPSTREMLQRATALRSDVRILLLCTARPEFTIDWPTREGVLEIDLAPLSGAEIRDIAKCAAPVGPRALDAIVERAEGNPFIAEELAGATTAGETESLPPSLHDSMMARLDALGADRHLAQVASVIGREFYREILVAIFDEADRRQIDEALHRFEACGLAVSHGLPPGSRYQFRHALLRDAAYESIPPERRAQLHARAARAIAEREPAWIERNPELIARHYEGAGLDHEAVDAWERAADRALESAANVEATAHLAQALAGISRLPASRGRDELELRLVLKRGRALLATRAHADPEVEETFSRAHALCRGLRPTVVAFRSLSEIWFHQTLLCDGRAFEMADELKQVAIASGDRHLEALAEASRASFFQFTARHRDALAAAARALALCDRSRRRADVHGLALDVVSFARATAARCSFLLGDLSRARREAELCEEAVAEVEHPFSSGVVESLLAYLFIGLGDYDHALALAEKNIARSDRFGLSYLAATARGARCQVRERAGDGDGALEDARAQLETLRAMGAVLSQGLAHIQLAGAHIAKGNFDAALDAASEGVRLSENPEDCALLSEALRVRGVILLRRGEEEGRKELLRAIEVAHEQEALSLELRAAIDLARSDGDPAADRARLRELVARFGPESDGVSLRQARVLLGG